MIRSLATGRPAHDGMAAMTSSIVGLRRGAGSSIPAAYATGPPAIEPAATLLPVESKAVDRGTSVEHARAVIIGGGVGGTSIAYHLAELGWTDIVLVDRAELTSGSTFHSAGLVGQLRSSVTLTRMMMYGVRPVPPPRRGDRGRIRRWHEVGSLRLASTQERFEELQRQAGWAKTFGLPLELITPAEAQAIASR